MAIRTSVQSKPQFLPPHVMVFLKARSENIAGLLCSFVGLALLAALISFNLKDPSANYVGAPVVQNWMGSLGAMWADIALQSFGIASVLLPLCLVTWGYRFASHQGLPMLPGRVLAMFVSMVVLSLSLAHAVRVDTWPLLSGMGGFLGDQLLFKVRQLAHDQQWTYPQLWVGMGLAVISIAGAIWALAISRADWRLIGRGASYAGQAGAWASERAWEAAKTLAEKRPSSEPIRRKFGAITSVDQDEMASEPARDPYQRIEPKFDDLTFDQNRPVARDLAPVKIDPMEEGPILPQPVVVDRKPEALPLIPETKSAEPKPKPKTVADVAKPLKEGKRAELEREPTLALEPQKSAGFKLPALALLAVPPPERPELRDPRGMEQSARMLESVLDDFGVNGEIVAIHPGPVVTLFELEPAPGTKSSRVIGLADDIARSMSAISVRAAVVPGRNVIGIEIPNQHRETVFLRELLASQSYEDNPGNLAMVLGKDIGGSPVIVDLSKMPHLLVAGTTGSGKSVGVNAMILSLLYRLSPEQVRFIMVDPKMLELSVYEGIPHLLTPVVTEPSKAVVALKWAVREMENRYRLLSQIGVRNIDGFNKRLAEAKAKGEKLSRKAQTGFDEQTNEPIYEEEILDLEPLPFIVVIIDEFSDLMMVAGKDVEHCVLRLAQMARAAGIHLIMATQRPSVDVITGTIKANFPSRISFQVTNKVDSRTILGQQGAEQLLGRGDLLYMPGASRITRVHGPFVSDEEVEKVVSHLKSMGKPQYVHTITQDPEEDAEGEGFGEEGEGDDLYRKAVGFVTRDKKASTSYVQRQLKIGYNRAATLIERMEREGIISAPNHVGKREILRDDY